MAERFRLFIDMTTPAFGEEPMAELGAILRTLAQQAEDDGFLGWMVIQDRDSMIVGELQIETLANEGEN